MKTVEEILDETGELYKARVIREGETWCEHDIICPYCARVQDDIWDNCVPEPGAGESEYQCGNCERHFMVSATVVFSSRRLK